MNATQFYWGLHRIVPKQLVRAGIRVTPHWGNGVMAKNAPGKHYRPGLTLTKLFEMFPDNAAADRQRRFTGRGGEDQVIFVGVLDRATGKVVAGPVADTSARTLTGIVDSVTADGADVFTDEHRSCKPLASLGYAHAAVAHSAEEFVRGDVHTNTIESLWSMFKRGYVGTCHHMSEAHLHRYVNEFTARHNVREMGTETQMETVAADMAGKRLRYADLIAA